MKFAGCNYKILYVFISLYLRIFIVSISNINISAFFNNIRRLFLFIYNGIYYFFTKKIDKLIKKYSVKDGKYEAAIGVGKDGMKEVFKRGTFEKLIDVPFEDMVVPIPENYDLFLTQFYGDYMQKPSDEEIAYKSHLLKAYWKK